MLLHGIIFQNTTTNLMLFYLFIHHKLLLLRVLSWLFSLLLKMKQDHHDFLNCNLRSIHPCFPFKLKQLLTKSFVVLLLMLPQLVRLSNYLAAHPIHIPPASTTYYDSNCLLYYYRYDLESYSLLLLSS